MVGGFIPGAVPAELSDYLSEVAARLSAALGGELTGVYVGGSTCLGGYAHGRSDVDVVAVSRAGIRRDVKERIVAQLRHELLPCPARGLELVVYAEATVRRPSAGPDFELELNTGSGLPYLACLDPADRPASLGTHWYVIDRAIVAERGIVLQGPPASELFTQAPRELVLPALAESLRWHGTDGAGRGDDAVLNGCRSLRYLIEGGVWSSKPDAGRWALGRLGADDLVAAALASRETGDALEARAVAAFLSKAERMLRQR